MAKCISIKRQKEFLNKKPTKGVHKERLYRQFHSCGVEPDPSYCLPRSPSKVVYHQPTHYCSHLWDDFSRQHILAQWWKSPHHTQEGSQTNVRHNKLLADNGNDDISLYVLNISQNLSLAS